VIALTKLRGALLTLDDAKRRLRRQAMESIGENDSNELCRSVRDIEDAESAIEAELARFET
jgi:hypothetical protein